MIGNGNITKFAHIEVSGCRPQWSLQRTIQTAPRFFLRYGLRPPLRKNLAPSPRRDMITLTSHSTWARKSTAGKSIALCGIESSFPIQINATRKVNTSRNVNLRFASPACMTAIRLKIQLRFNSRSWQAVFRRGCE